MRQLVKNVLITFCSFIHDGNQYTAGVKVIKQISIYKGHMYALNEIYGSASNSQFTKDD